MVPSSSTTLWCQDHGDRKQLRVSSAVARRENGLRLRLSSVNGQPWESFGTLVTLILKDNYYSNAKHPQRSLATQQQKRAPRNAH